MELRLAELPRHLRSSLNFWTADHPAIRNFKWKNSWGASWNFAVSSVILYLLMVATLSFLRRNQKRGLSLSYIPTVHNLVLTVGSLVMFIGCLNATLIEMRGSRWLWGKGHGAEWLLCFPLGTRSAGRVFFWSYIYYLSKFYELLDTVILILKNRPLTFLHVFHHATVIFMCFFWLQYSQSLQIIALLTNTGVHVIMYTYYFLCSLNRPPPWKKLVTNLQIVQFAFSFVCGVATAWLHFGGQGCAGMNAFLFNTLFNITLFVLFLNFHKTKYGEKGSKGPGSRGQRGSDFSKRDWVWSHGICYFRQEL